MSSLTKAELVEAVYDKIGFSKKEAAEVVETAISLVKDSLKNHETVKISGFGSFQIRHKRARRGRNPQTSENITIRQRYVLSFRPSQLFRDALNPGREGASPIPSER